MRATFIEKCLAVAGLILIICTVLSLSGCYPVYQQPVYVAQPRYVEVVPVPPPVLVVPFGAYPHYYVEPHYYYYKR